MLQARLTVASILVALAGCEAMSPNEGDLFSGPGDAESTARAFLEAKQADLGLDVPGLTLALSTTRQGLAGTYLRFGQRQQVGDAVLPVFGGEVVVLVRDDGTRRVVRAVNAEHHRAAGAVQERGDLGAEVFRARAQALLGLEAPPRQATRGVFVTKEGEARVAWAVQASTESPPHDWTLFFDAASGELLRQRDGVRSVDGVAYVFDMNPITSSGVFSLTDGSDATSTALDAARFRVVLPRLDGTGFTSGQWANVSTRTTSARASSPTLEFLFSRDQLGFEQANVYYHLDRTQAHLQALGFTDVNARIQEATVDAQTADNSFYSPNSRRLSFGRGGVDDAEDGDIITHEYGHAIQDDQVPGFGDGDEGAMGEGFGDYLAASFGETLAADAGHPQRADSACVGDWDATSYGAGTPRCLRRVDGNKHFPEDADDEVHEDGEIWSAALWALRGQLGADVMDRLIIESHFLLGTASSFATAAQAVQTADQNLFMGQHVDTLRRGFIRFGLSRQLSTPPEMGVVSFIPVSLGPGRDANGNYRANRDERRTLTVPGAKGLRLHFTRVELETHASCFQQGCDNLYLTNGDGDLFQVISGSAGELTSVAVSGDTLTLRLVTDGSEQRFGFHVDRLEVLDAPADAGLVYDGGMDRWMMDGGAPDGGAPPRPDAGASDGGTRVVSLEAVGTEPLSPALERGCGCGATGGAAVWLSLLFLSIRSWRRRAA